MTTSDASTLRRVGRRTKEAQGRSSWSGKMSGVGIDRPKSLTEHAYDRLKAAIREGSLEPRRFYPLGDVASAFGISRTPVREAVLKLAHDGLLEILPQRGFRVREIPPEEAAEVFELRTLIEGRAVEKLGRFATEKDVRDFRAILRRQQRATHDTASFLNIDEEFHLTMLERAGLRRAREFLITLRDVIWILGFDALGLPGRLDEVLVEHTNVVDFIERHDPERARRALDTHLTSTFSKIKAARGGADYGLASPPRGFPNAP